jgi:two-component system, chemotaxis family, protein-glutamate methylesterase/glutaminase
MNQEATIRPVNRGMNRVLVVDDSAFMRTALTRMIASEAGFEVVGTAASGGEALEKIPLLDPDVVTLDVEMPGLDGLQTLRAIMNKFPRPVLMVSSITEKNAEATFDALSAGAFDYIPKQMSASSLDILHIRAELITKLRAAAFSRKVRESKGRGRKPPQSSGFEVHELEVHGEERGGPTPVPAIVVMGTSTGGPKALQEILPLLPRDLPVPILIVQHMPPGFTAAFARRLDALCAVTVRQAAHRDRIRPATVYLAPAGMHMTVERANDLRSFIRLDPRPENCIHVPSVNILMKSVADSFKNSAMGVIMTGMGSDGAEGMMAIHRKGGFTVGQDELTCTVYGMPRVCAEMGSLNSIVPLSEIPAQILQATRYRKRA